MRIGKVGRNVNAFIDTLQNVMGRITDSSLRMNQIIREVDDKVRSSNENSDDISTAMEELSASMISVADMVSGITKNMKEVEDRTKDFRKNRMVFYPIQIRWIRTRINSKMMQF